MSRPVDLEVRTAFYLCHKCGNLLVPIDIEASVAEYNAARWLWCKSCGKRRKKPTHPALIR